MTVAVRVLQTLVKPCSFANFGQNPTSCVVQSRCSWHLLVNLGGGLHRFGQQEPALQNFDGHPRRPLRQPSDHCPAHVQTTQSVQQTIESAHPRAPTPTQPGQSLPTPRRKRPIPGSASAGQRAEPAQRAAGCSSRWPSNAPNQAPPVGSLGRRSRDYWPERSRYRSSSLSPPM